MNNKIKELLGELDKEMSNYVSKKAGIEHTLQLECDAYFKTNKDVQAIIKLVNEKPSGFQFSEYGDIEEFYRIKVDLNQFKEVKEYLSNYVQNQTCGYIDFENEVLVINQGPDEIVINDDGDVFQGHKRIIDASDYENNDQRNELIEKHMEKTGFYPGVFECDCFNNLRLVNTQKRVGA